MTRNRLIYILITTLPTVKPFVFYPFSGQLVRRCLLPKDLDLSSLGSSSLVDIYPVRSYRSSGYLSLSPRYAEFLSLIITARYLPCGPIVDERILKLSCPVYKLNAGIVFPYFHPLSQCLHVSWAVFCRIQSFNIIRVNRQTNHAP